MRVLLGETIIGFPAPDARTPGGAAVHRAIHSSASGRPADRAAVAPHALYTNSDETLRACRALANRYGAPLLTHVAETRGKWTKPAKRKIESG